MREELKRQLAAARAAGRTTLLEHEGLALAEAIGIGVPDHVVVQDAAEATHAVARFAGDRVVVKVLSPAILHKSDVGGIEIVAKADVPAAVARIGARCQNAPVAGFLLAEVVEHDRALGGELLVAVRFTADFGPVVTFGAGGVYTEFLAERLRPGVAIFSPALADERAVDAGLAKVAVTPLLTGALRNQPARVSLEDLRGLIARLLEFARDLVPEPIAELEINPLVPTPNGFVALDALAKLGGPQPAAAPPRPLDKLQHLLQPASIALIGVSEKMNPGRIILQNILREGFPPDRIHIVKPGTDAIDGCACYPDVAALPESVDLFVMCVAAPMIPAVMRDVVAQEKAQSVILIPGGLGEREGSEGHRDEVLAALRASRDTAWRGPVVNGANCLGIRSLPGRYDTLFIPEHKLSFPARQTPLAFLSQSGAFAVARSSKLCSLGPRYVATIGNQIDLTVGDYLTFLKDDPEVQVVACYVEGFRPLDGRRWLEAAREFTQTGRTIVLYRAGRTTAGARATASHSASIAGDYAVTRELAEAAGVLVAETLADFEDLVRLCVSLRDKPVGGRRLGAVSNAGFECVAFADNLAGFTLADFAPATRAELAATLERARIGDIVAVQNPVDLTPMANDAAFEATVRAVLGDPGVDVGVIGCVPLTGAMNTLPAGDGHREDLSRDDSFAHRLGRVHREIDKAWIAVVDGGPIYQPMVQLLEQLDIPTFRTADRALRLFARYCERRLDG